MQGKQDYYSHKLVEDSDTTKEAEKSIIDAEQLGEMVIRIHIYATAAITARELFLSADAGSEKAVLRCYEELERIFLLKLPQCYPEFVDDAREFWNNHQMLRSMVRYKRDRDGTLHVEMTDAFSISEARMLFEKMLKIANQYSIPHPHDLDVLISMFEDVGYSLKN